MNIPLDHECFNWEWCTSETGWGIKFYFTYDENGDFGWRNLKNGEFNRWLVPIERIEKAIESGEWKRVKERPAFCGPMQPPPSKVILKIRQMEARRKHVQCG